MPAVANNPGLFSLGAANASTGWLVFEDLVEDPTFNITGTFVGTISMQVSNQSAATKDQYSTVTTYTTTSAPLGLPYDLGRFVRFIMTAYTSGTAYVGFSKGISVDGQQFDLIAQGASSDGSGAF